MSHSDSELTTAAAEGAAAAVAAVQDDQAEAERQAGMENAAVTAEIAAEVAEERAESATETASVAVEVSSQASQEASVAAETASVAAAVAYSARQDLAALRTELSERDARLESSLRSALDEKFGTREQQQEPTEVVVKHDDTNTGQGTDAGSGGSAGTGTERPARRHGFGSRRG